MIGLKRGMVELADHDPEWEFIAADTIWRLWRIFGSSAKEFNIYPALPLHASNPNRLTT